jgi:hypothetical protein
MSKKAPEAQSQGWAPALSALQDQFLPEVKSYGRAFDRGQGLYSGSLLAGEHEYVRRGDKMAKDAIPGIQGMLGQTNEALSGFLNYDPNSFQNRAARDALNANVTAAFNESIRPAIEDRGTFGGQYGGSQVGNALGAATAPLSRALADSEVNLMNADRNRAMQAMQMSPGLISQNLLPSQIISDIGSRRTQRGQQERFDFIQQQEAERRNRLQSLQEMQSLYGPLAGGGGTSTMAPGSSGLGGVLTGALGGAATGASIGGGPYGAIAGAAIGGIGALL